MARTRALLSVLCVALVLLAGCSGLGGGTATPDGDGTATNGTTTNGTTVVEDPNGSDPDDDVPANLPPGVSEDGLDDPSALLDAHDAVIGERGAVTVTNTTIEAPRASLTSNSTVTFGADGSIAVRTTSSVGQGSFETRQYTNGSVSVIRQVTSQAERQTAFTGSSQVERGAGLAGLQSILAAAEVSVAGADDGAVRLTVEGVADGANATTAGGGNYTQLDGHLVVRESGLIESLELTVTQDIDGQETTTDVDYEVTETGVDAAPRGDWVDEVLAEESLPQLTYERTDGAIAITNEGDDPIPRGSVVSVSETDSEGRTTEQYSVQLRSTVEPGETVYVYRTDADSIQGEQSVGSPPAGDTAPIDGEVRVVIQGQGGIVDATILADGDDEDESEG